MSYATPVERVSYVGAAILCGTGVLLMMVAGCFLIGVLIFTEKSGSWRDREVMLATALYACCLGCAGTALVVLVMGVRRALR